jgi:catechol 2,3-dioxygenase-like lactoylglutathione lyase family enzyme
LSDDIYVDRRQFLKGASASLALLAAHLEGSPAEAGMAGTTRPAGPPSAAPPRLLALELLTAAPLAAMKEFYRSRLGLKVLAEKADRVTIGGGATPITFVSAPAEQAKPFYHFAFNIPENKLRDARRWQLDRTPLIPMPPWLRDPAYPDDVANFSHWNAHSVFFLDPGGNVVEYIARHDLQNAAPGGFGPADILYASEIGLIVDDVPAAALALREAVAGLRQYRGGDDQFTALGDEQGLLLVMKRGRRLNFNPASDEKAARVFRTAARIRGERPAHYAFPQLPYEIAIE